MNRFLLKNDTTENVSARVTVSPSDELGNLGHDAATVIEGDRLTTCLAPTAVALPEPTGFRSQCFELNDNGRYAVEINGVVQPYAFTPADLLDCFNGQHESLVRFLECTEDKCAGAINKLLFWGGDGADITQCTVSAIALDGQEVFGLSEGGLLDIDRATDNLIVWFSEDSLMYGFGHFINKDPNNTHRVAVCYEGVDVATIKSYFVDTDNPTLTIKAITSTKAIEMFPENFSPEGQYSDLVLVEFCLSPAEPKPEISCDGAISSVSLLVDLYWQGESGAIVWIADDETGERITDIQGYYVDHFNPDRDTMAKMANVFSSGDYFVVTGGAMDDFDSATDPYGQRHYRQTITISNKRQQPTRIRIEVNGLNDEGFSRSKVEIVDPLNPTYFVLDDTETDMVVSKVCLAAARPEIVCDGAAPVFEAKTSFETNVIEVSVDGGPWVDIYSAEGIYVSFMPGNPGADIRFNLEGSDPKRVRVRTSRDIGLYVNPISGFDQINTNKAYTLYDRNGVMIDPFDPDNHDYSGDEFDDTTTTDDYAVFFAEAEFCLATESEEWVDLITFKTDGKEITAKEGNGQGESLRLINVDTGEVELGLPHFNLLTPGNYKLQFLSGEDISNWAVVVKGKGLTEITDWCTYGDVLAYTCDSSPNLIKVPSYAPTQTNSLNMFLAGCTILNDPNISNWDVSKFTDMGYMFAGCKAFNQPLDQWDVSNVTYMGYMFNGATAFNQDLSDWCVAKIATKPIGFDGGAEAFVLEHKPVWGTCPNGS